MKNKNLKTLTTLFLQAYLQVAMVVANTYFISKDYLPGIIIASFLISYIWSHNVKKIAVASEFQRWTYSIGAMTGGLTGYFIGQLIL